MFALRSFILALSLVTFVVQGDYISYPRPSIYQKSQLFSLKINGTYMYTVDYDPYDYVQLCMDEGPETEFRIKLNSGETINSFNISPQKLPINARKEGNEIIFTLKKVHYLIVHLNNHKEFVVMIDPMESNVPKPSGSGIHNVLDYKADKSGNSLSTNAIQSALDDAGKSSGSIVYVPPGLYTAGNLVLRSQTSLYLAGGAVLRFTGNPKDYKKFFRKTSLNMDGTWWITTDFGSKDIKIYGRGVIDGNGRVSRQNKYVAHVLAPAGTTNFHLDGILIRDGPFWTVAVTQVTGAQISNLKILNRFELSEDDGIDIIESTNVNVNRAIAISNDDSFSTKTWPDHFGISVPYPYNGQEQSDVVFDECLAWTYCYAFKVGEGVYEHQNRVTFQNSVAYFAGVGLGVNHKYGTSAASHVSFRNMDLEKLSGRPGGHGGWLVLLVQDGGKGVGPVDHVYVKNTKVRSKGSGPSIIRGTSGAKIDVVTIEDVYMPGSKTTAKTLGEMDIGDTSNSENVRIRNLH